MDIRAFQGWRYAADEAGSITAYLAPPYDILSGGDKQALLARSDRNIVAVDLPQVPPKQAGPEEVYRQAARRLRRWQEDGTLVRDDRPGLYVYQQRYAWAGRSYTRTAMICGVRASELGESVIPHEHTFPGPRADRLKLTQHTHMQLSPVFGFYRDDGGRVEEHLQAAARGEPIARGRLGDLQERLWRITDDAQIEAVAEALRDEPVFIADGHHRYATALTYAKELRGGGRGDEHEANFVMFALVADSDPGLVIRPTHRIVRGLREGFSLDELRSRAAAFSWQRYDARELDVRDADALAARGAGAMAFVSAGAAEVWVARLAEPAAMKAAAPDKPDAWRALDVAVLHELIVEGALEPWRGADRYVEYTPDAGRVLEACRRGEAKLGVCLQPPSLSAVRAVALAGEAMPHKTTYFYPKLTTGMVLKPLE